MLISLKDNYYNKPYFTIEIRVNCIVLKNNNKSKYIYNFSVHICIRWYTCTHKLQSTSHLPRWGLHPSFWPSKRPWTWLCHLTLVPQIEWGALEVENGLDNIPPLSCVHFASSISTLVSFNWIFKLVILIYFLMFCSAF